MSITGQAAIESASQSFFLTIPPFHAISRAGQFQGAGLYNGAITAIGVAPSFPGGSSTAFGLNPIFFTGPTGIVTTGRFEVWNIKWVGKTAGDRCTIKDAAGKIVFDSIAVAGMPEDYPMMAGMIWTGFQISQLDSGILYLYYDTPGQLPPFLH